MAVSNVSRSILQEAGQTGCLDTGDADTRRPFFFFFHRADSYNLDSVASKLDIEEKKAEDRTLARLIIRETREHTSPSGGYAAKH